MLVGSKLVNCVAMLSLLLFLVTGYARQQPNNEAAQAIGPEHTSKT